MRFVKCIKGGFIMAKVRKICNTGSNKKIIIVKTVKKSKQKPKEGNQFGSGNSGIQTPTGSKSKPKEILPDIKDMEKEVLKSIIGQDVAVRKIITAIYRAINFKTVKSNILVIGYCGFVFLMFNFSLILFYPHTFSFIEAATPQQPVDDFAASSF